MKFNPEPYNSVVRDLKELETRLSGGNMSKKQLTQSDLDQFTGTETWYKHGLNRRVTFTEGVKFLADKAGAYWLIDEIALAQIGEPRVKAEEFQVWKLAIVNNEGYRAKLTCEDGNGNEVYAKYIEFTDFPLAQVTVWFTDNVILLPSEY